MYQDYFYCKTIKLRMLNINHYNYIQHLLKPNKINKLKYNKKIYIIKYK